MSIHFMGVDAGGTRTRALLATTSGEVVGRGAAEGANAWSSGGSAAGAIAAAMREALGELDPGSVVGGCIAVAGGISSVPEQAARVVDEWQALGLTGAPRIVVDVAAAYAAGTTHPRGLVLTAGTGAIAALVDSGELVRRAGGRGWLVGDEGSAVWLGVEGVRAVLLALDGRGPKTSLVEPVASVLGVPTAAGVDVPTRITDEVYSGSPAKLGRLAPEVVRQAEAGDEVALVLVERAAQQLAETAFAAAGDEQPPVVVLGGSVLTRAAPIGDPVRAMLGARWPDAPVVETGSGEAGAVTLAIHQHTGTPVSQALLHRLRTGG